MIAFTSLLNNIFTISRRRRTADGQGGWAIDYVELGTVNGRLRPASSSEREIAMREEREITHVLYVAAGANVARRDLVTLGDLVVEVMAVREPSHAGAHLEIDCRQRQEETSTDG